MANIDVDKILLSLGWFGPYQRQQCVYFAFALTGAAYAILAYTFAGKFLIDNLIFRLFFDPESNYH